MRCRDARRAIVDNELGQLGAERSSALEDHLSDCPACSRRLRSERRLECELAALRILAIFETAELAKGLDVAPGVMRAIERLPRSDRRDVPARQLGGASAVAALLALLLIPAFVFSVPEPSRLLPVGRGLSLALGHLMDRGLALVSALLTLARSLLHGIVETVGALGSTLMLVEPAAQVAAIAGYAAMALIVLAVLGRDLARGAPIARKER